jgi:uncharacterized protein YkwD
LIRTTLLLAMVVLASCSMARAEELVPPAPPIVDTPPPPPIPATTPRPSQVDPEVIQTAQVVTEPVTYQAPVGDPYGFLGWLNSTRARYGLGAVGYDANLANWAAMNNNQQAASGIGHFVMGPARRQNSGMGDMATVCSMWMASPAHQAALLDPTITAVGIASLGAYWTFNAY